MNNGMIKNSIRSLSVSAFEVLQYSSDGNNCISLEQVAVVEKFYRYVINIEDAMVHYRVRRICLEYLLYTEDNSKRTDTLQQINDSFLGITESLKTLSYYAKLFMQYQDAFKNPLDADEYLLAEKAILEAGNHALPVWVNGAFLYSCLSDYNINNNLFTNVTVHDAIIDYSKLSLS